MSFKWHCLNCDNTERFHAAAVEYHSWEVDGEGDFLNDLSVDESIVSEVHSCAACGSNKIEWKEVMTPMGMVLEKLLTENGS